MSLEVIAMRWLWLEKNCHYISRERSPRWGCGEPDALGVTKDRYLVEIEIKRSLSDYAADFRKRHRINRDAYLEQCPKFFYYMAEKSLAEKMVKRLPKWAGLLSVEHYTVTVLKSAPANRESSRIDLKECVKIARKMTNHMMALECKIDHHMSQWTQRYWDFYPMSGDFQI